MKVWMVKNLLNQYQLYPQIKNKRKKNHLISL